MGSKISIRKMITDRCVKILKNITRTKQGEKRLMNNDERERELCCDVDSLRKRREVLK